ncbi:unnamed protein product [Notodromas monacha]|uniref:Uncharacterized protein n=1 Tax=Notodromas monacha TaxID=399045 RepID=A0A7R9BVJ7_9CRUS|nr:unnamed protein product [Notodromas monacha]CAG0921400.1 unnamed protein product [Notodromas monacha]
MDLANIGYRRLIDRALCDKDMKARWNSCYAISCALSNENLDSSTLERWSKEATCELQPLMTDFKNLKVRIRAAAVVLAVSERSSFGDTFLGLWKALIFGIENVRNIADFCEYQHVSGVVEQAYKDFYSTYDADKAYEKMKTYGYFQAVPKGGFSKKEEKEEKKE